MLVVYIPFAYISIKYGLNYSNALPSKNNPIYATWSITEDSFKPLFRILSLIYVRNPLSFNLLPKNLLIDGILTFIMLSASIYSLKLSWLIFIFSIISLS